jgi:hypothetical protein
MKTPVGTTRSGKKKSSVCREIRGARQDSNLRSSDS